VVRLGCKVDKWLISDDPDHFAVDDRRLGLVVRALRRKRGWRQTDLANAADVSDSVVGRAEAGHFDTLSLQIIRRLLAALDARLDLNARWRGGELDRLVDSRHAAIVTAASTELVDRQWLALQEVTYAIYRESGSIDLLGLRPAEAVALVTEIKSEVTSWEETQRRLDEKVRLLPKIVFERVGWRPRVVGKVLILDDTMTNRRRVASLGAAVQQAYPARTVDVRRWIREPVGPMAGIWFLSIPTPQGLSDVRGGSHRVRVPQTIDGHRRGHLIRAGRR
jgi:transcriptional regulator with XRE-family HTH domain